jgi:hypothetical protein
MDHALFAQITASHAAHRLTALSFAKPVINNSMYNNRLGAATRAPLELLAVLSQQFSNACQDSTFKILYVFTV